MINTGAGVLEIGKHVIIQPLVTILCKGFVRIGNGTQIATGVVIVDHDHEIQKAENIHQTGTIEDVWIGNDCWIGANAVILKGVRLENHTIVGAGAVVTKSFDKGNIVIAGNPAKIIKEL